MFVQAGAFLSQLYDSLGPTRCFASCDRSRTLRQDAALLMKNPADNETRQTRLLFCWMRSETFFKDSQENIRLTPRFCHAGIVKSYKKISMKIFIMTDVEGPRWSSVCIPSSVLALSQLQRASLWGFAKTPNAGKCKFRILPVTLLQSTDQACSVTWPSSYCSDQFIDIST